MSPRTSQVDSGGKVSLLPALKDTNSNSPQCPSVQKASIPPSAMSTSSSRSQAWSLGLLLTVISIGFEVLCELGIVYPLRDTHFYENDPSINYPYQPDTVSNAGLFGCCALGFVGLWWVKRSEVQTTCGQQAQSKSRLGPTYGSVSPELQTDSRNLLEVKVVDGTQREDQTELGKTKNLEESNPYALFPYLLIALNYAQLLHWVIKLIVCRPRPCFLQWCGYQFSENNSSSNLLIPGNYENCAKTTAFGRCSFLSGHAALVFCSAHFLAREAKKHSVLQFFAYAVAGAVSISRLTDYKHHPEDVICGALLGVCCASLGRTMYHGL